MKSALVLCGLVVALLAVPAFADSVSFENQGLVFGGTTGGGVLAGSNVHGITIGGTTSPGGALLVFGTGTLLGNVSEGGTFSSGIISLNLVSTTIFASNFTGSWTKITNDLYELSGNSNNAGVVKYFLSALTRALRRARHFALVEALPYQPKARS
jgi:hypothetical protein